MTTYTYTLPLAQLIEEFQKLPGIGPKSAQRLAFHVLKQPQEVVRHFSETLLSAKTAIGECALCFNLSSQSPCEICRHPDRSDRCLAIVTDPQDLYALERTDTFHGRYHVLHGLISPMEGLGPDDLKIRELIARLEQSSCSHEASQPRTTVIEEVILALPPSIEGDTTSLYLSRLIKPLGIRLTRIAFGIPVGGNLDYADNLTIARALEGRRDIP